MWTTEGRGRGEESRVKKTAQCEVRGDDDSRAVLNDTAKKPEERGFSRNMS